MIGDDIVVALSTAIIHNVFGLNLASVECNGSDFSPQATPSYALSTCSDLVAKPFNSRKITTQLPLSLEREQGQIKKLFMFFQCFM